MLSEPGIAETRTQVSQRKANLGHPAIKSRKTLKLSLLPSDYSMEGSL